MNIELIRADIEDAEEIMDMQKKSFRGLLDKYQDYEVNPWNESLERIKQKIITSYYYFILYNGIKVGAIRVVNHSEDKKKRIAPIYILPEYRGKKIAQNAIRKVEEIHGADNWKLDTILEEKENCHLYEKLGYRKTGEYEKISDIETIVFYEK